MKDFKIIYDDIFVINYDEEAMYPNISTDEGLSFAMAALDSFLFKVTPIWTKRYLLLAIRLMLKCNVFQFDDAYFR